MRWLDAVGDMCPDDYKVAVSLGHVPGWRAFLIHGHNPDISGLEDLWAPGGIRVLPLAAGPATVVSSSALDTLADGGARVVSIEGLDDQYNEVVLAVPLNGTTPVVTAQSFLRINKVVCTLCGGATNVGDISVSVGGNLQAYIPAGSGVTSQLAYAVPAGHIFVIDRYSSSVSPNNANSQVQLLGQARLYNPASANNYEAWRTMSHWMTGEGAFTNEGSRPLPAKSDYRVQVNAANATNRATVSIGGYIVKLGFA